MSEKQLSKAGEKPVEYKNFWRAKRPKLIYNMFVQGKTVAEICEATHLTPENFSKLISNPMFLRKLECHLRGILFAHQAAQIIGLEEVTNKLWERVRNNIDNISVEVCLKELVKLLPLQKEHPKLNLRVPKDSNVQVNLGNFGTSSKMEDAIKRFDEQMGHEGLKEDEKAEYIEGNTTTEEINPNKDEQQNPEVDPEDGSKNG